jgi:cystathionine beta-lyase
MDFHVAPAIQAAIERVVSAKDYGYYVFPGAKGTPHPLAVAYAARMQSRYGWSADAALARPVTDLVQGLYAAVTAFSEAGQGVVIQSPIYPPIRNAVLETGRRVVTLPMTDTGARYDPDIARLAASIDRETRLILLCNPHNPTGRALSHAELSAIGQIAVEHDLVVVADEIHAELVFDGATHIPFASLSEAVAALTITLFSATKSFNIPGLRTGVMHFGSPALMARFNARIPARIMGSVNSIGIAATLAAWQEGDPWLGHVLTHLTQARDRTMALLSAELPEIGVRCPEATYLLWLDCRALGLNSKAVDFFRDEARIAFSAGENFEPGAEQFVRLNFATSLPILEQIVGRMVDATRTHRGA